MNNIADVIYISAILANCSTEELLDEVARRYNRNPATIRDAITGFMYTFDAIESAKEVVDEGGDHGRPF